MKKFLLATVILLLPFAFVTATPVGKIYECQSGAFYGAQRYSVVVHISQGSAPNGSYPITFSDGNTAYIECTDGVCGPNDLDLGHDMVGPPIGQSYVHTITLNGNDYTGTATGVSLCYPDGVCPTQICLVVITIEAEVLPLTEHLTSYDDKIGGNLCQSGWVPMARYAVHSMLVSLNIEDTPLRYTPPRGPAIDFTVTYNQKENQQPANFSYSNLGPKWTFNWLAYVADNPDTQLPFTSVYVPGGGAELYAFDSTSQTFSPDPQSHALLVRPNPKDPDLYERRFPDGSKQIFSQSDGATTYPRKVFMTQMVDSAGNSASIEYDSSLRITKIKDALNQETHVYYELQAEPLRITKVEDPFGRFATFTYENGKLETITDEIGIQSVFTYQPGTDSVATLTTPYGTTSFESGGTGTNQWIEITDPLLAKERVEYRDHAPGISPTDLVAPSAAGIVNANLDTANTFFWDRKAMAVAPGDYTKARIKHWLYSANGSVSGILSSEKLPLESRVWFTYLGQPDYLHAGPSGNPSQVARVLADGTTQLLQYEYNGVGKMTKGTDPIGRVMTFIYDSNQVDLLEIRQATGTNNELLRQLTYNSLHEPLTDADAAGQVTSYTYNSYGQMLTRANAKGEITTCAYDRDQNNDLETDGYPISVTSPSFNERFAVTTFGYDNFSRIRTITDETDQYTVTTDYDDLDRPTQITYPDGTIRLFRYTRYNEQNVDTGVMTLDLTATCDRSARWTYRHYNANRQMESITDPLVRTTNFEWCTCGALESLTDPKGQVTRFHRDLQGRVHQKVFADNTTVNYLFEGQTGPNTAGATSRLKSSTDALNRRTNYSYFIDNNVSQVSYTNTSGGQLSPPTPTVDFTYDANYNRVETMTDGTGLTTYGYYPVGSGLGAGKVQSIDGPLGSDAISFTYDELGRKIDQSIDGVAETVAYDTLGRLTTTNNALGSFERSYDGVTPRLQTLAYPSGQIANYTYFGNDHDRRLQTLENLDRQSATLSKFDYTYDAEGQITSWTKLLGTTASGRWFEYDDALQLLGARNASDAADVTHRFDYGYDAAGNRTNDADTNFGLHHVSGQSHEYTINVVNQIDTSTPWVLFPHVHPLPTASLSYDATGNMTNDGVNMTFEWDAANRLTAVEDSTTGSRSEFTYDGLSRRVKIVEKNGSTVTSTKQFVWVGNRIAQERDASNNVTRSYFAEGEVHGNAHVGYENHYYTRDHLGSIREMTSGSSGLQARYDYDPYGHRIKLGGAFDVDFGYTGHYFHAPSSLNLTLYRAYNPELGRWLSRDPIEEAGGVNLHGYVENDPINGIDPLGLFEVLIFDPVGQGHSSFGHTATVVNGTAYSWGPGGMAMLRVADYLARNDFRNGIGLNVPFSEAEDKALQDCLAHYQSSGSYNWLSNSCTDPLQRCLKQRGYNVTSVLGGSAFTPAGLASAIATSFPGVTLRHYPASHR